MSVCREGGGIVPEYGKTAQHSRPVSKPHLHENKLR